MSGRTYNRKRFLAPKSHRSMASFHAKVMEDGVMKLTIHNNLGNKDEVLEAIEKLTSLITGIEKLREFITNEYLNRE